MKHEDVDKIKRTIDDSVPVFIDVDKALDDNKISIFEGADLIISHGGKLLRLVEAAREIMNEVIDLDGDEAEEIMDQIAESYGQGDPAVKEAAKNIVVGLASLRTGVVGLIEARNANKEAAE